MTEYLTARRLAEIRELLSGRDHALLGLVADARFVTGGQLCRLFFGAEDYATADTAARMCRSSLQRLTDLELLRRVQRRIGGVRKGSSAFVYTLGPAGYRLFDRRARRRADYEPSLYYLLHTVAVNEVAVEIQVAAKRRSLDLMRLEREPRCWRTFGTARELHPDLFVDLDTDDYRLRWFVEVDRGTETLPHLVKKCRTYDAYYRTGQEQERHDGVFPRVLWLMSDTARVQRLRQAIQATRGLNPDMFVVGTADHALDLLKGGDV